MKPGDLVKHFRTGQLGVLLRAYEVYNDNVPEEVSYVRYIVQTPNGVISTYLNRFGVPMESVRHSGDPVIRGEKIVMTLWQRESMFTVGLS